VSCSDSSGCTELDYRVINWHTVGPSTAQMKTSLFNDGPSYWRFDVYDDFPNFWHNAFSGIVYVNSSGSTRLGGHAVLLIGWDNTKGAFLCKNSWGATSGPQRDGTFWISYAGHGHNLSFMMANFSLDDLSGEDPVADFTWTPQTPCVGETVSFDASASYDPDGWITVYAWDFENDGEYDAWGEDVDHPFNPADTYTVKLWIQDNDGNTDEVFKTITVQRCDDDTIYIDDEDPEFYILSGEWSQTDHPDAFGNSARYTTAGDGSKKAAWRVDTRVAPGTYDLFVSKFDHKYSDSMATNARYKVFHKNGVSNWIFVDQSTPNDEYIFLGSFEFDNSSPQGVKTTDNVNGVLIVDAIALVYTGSPE